MSSSTALKQYTVAILGGTGALGQYISRIFLTEYRTQFPNVRITTRDPKAQKCSSLSELGAALYSFDHPINDLLSGVDVVVNALPSDIVKKNQKQILEALVRNNVKVYFMSEYGVDYRFNEFDGYEHSDWVNKRAITAETRAATQGKTKVIAVVTGMFLGWLLHPDLGFDVEKNVYSPLGPGTLRAATTAESDIGRSIAQLAVLALDPVTTSTVPDDVRVSGQNPSYEDVRDAVSRVKGVPKGEIKSDDLAAYKAHLSQHPTENVYHYIRVLVGEGKVDFSTDNTNEFFNPGQKLWKWKTVEDQLRGQA